MITGLIFDRTAADVAHAQALIDKLASGVAYDDLTNAEKAEMQTGCRGCYNYTDLNRVQDAIHRDEDIDLPLVLVAVEVHRGVDSLVPERFHDFCHDMHLQGGTRIPARR